MSNKTYDDYYKLLPNNSIENITSLDELDEVGIRFGGRVYLGPSIVSKMYESNSNIAELEFVNGAGFQIIVDIKATIQYVSRYYSQIVFYSNDTNQLLIKAESLIEKFGVDPNLDPYYIK